ncbi:MAG: N-acetylneuraminate synthase [Desulfobacteraceae bacterium]|nr:MAG: N-acetylneuraminate synthase [Desulfobacteraceae bacterium]
MRNNKNLFLKRLTTRQNCIIIGEVAQAHDGSLGMAHAYIDAIADAGADAVKFQTHIASAESTIHEPWRVKFSLQDKTRYDYWKRMEFTEDQWKGLRNHAEERGMFFLSSPFSSEAVDMLTRVGVDAWKIASGEVTNTPMFEGIVRTRLPVLLSTGMSLIHEVDEAVKEIQAAGLPLVILQCTSMYPTPAEKIGLNMIPFFRERYNCLAGLSDHSSKIFPGIVAASMNIDVLEVHVTLSREMFGPDVLASLTTHELGMLVEGIRFVETMMDHPVDKDGMADSLKVMRQLFTKSIVTRKSIKAGSIIKEKDLAIKKPGGGLPAERLSEVIGMRLLKTVSADHILQEGDLEKR